MLPAYQMWARLEPDTSHFTSDLPPITMPLSHSGVTTSEPLGVQQTRDGVVVSGSGSLEVWGNATVEAEDLGLLIQVTSLQVRLSFGVAGIDRRVELLAKLYRTTPAAAQMIRWKFEELATSPWSDLAP